MCIVYYLLFKHTQFKIHYLRCKRHVTDHVISELSQQTENMLFHAFLDPSHTQKVPGKTLSTVNVIFFFFFGAIIPVLLLLTKMIKDSLLIET